MIPDFIKQFAKGYFQTGDQTTEDFSPELVDTLRSAAATAAADGRMNITYKDYPEMAGGYKADDWVHGRRTDVSTWDKVKTAATDPVFNTAFTIGQGTLKVEDGKVYLVDEYDFSKVPEDYEALGRYGQLRKWAGENFPEEGNKIKIELGSEAEVIGVPVAKGDTLGKIAKQYGFSVGELAEYNNIADPNKLSIGQRIRIPTLQVEEEADPIQAALDSILPKTAPPAAATPTPTKLEDVVQPVAEQYTIKSGDTLSAIAKRYGTTVAELAARNGIKDVNKIYAGQTLEV